MTQGSTFEWKMIFPHSINGEIKVFLYESIYSLLETSTSIEFSFLKVDYLDNGLVLQISAKMTPLIRQQAHQEATHILSRWYYRFWIQFLLFFRHRSFSEVRDQITQRLESSIALRIQHRLTISLRDHLQQLFPPSLKNKDL